MDKSGLIAAAALWSFAVIAWAGALDKYSVPGNQPAPDYQAQQAMLRELTPAPAPQLSPEAKQRQRAAITKLRSLETSVRQKWLVYFAGKLVEAVDHKKPTEVLYYSGIIEAVESPK